MLRLARSGPDQAYAYWQRIRERFDEAEHSYFMVQLADQAARRLNPRALGWFMEAATSSQPAPCPTHSLAGKPAPRCVQATGSWCWKLLKRCPARNSKPEYGAIGKPAH